MTAADAIREAGRLGIILNAPDGAAGRLGYDAPAGALPDALRAALVARKAEVLEIVNDPTFLPGPADRTWLHPDSLAPVSAAQDAVDHLFDLLSEGVILARLGPHADTLADRLARSTEPDPGQVRLLIALAGPVAWPFSAPDGVPLETSGGVV